MSELTDLLNQFAETCLVLGKTEFGMRQVETVPESVLLTINSVKKRKAELAAQMVALFNQAIIEAMRDQRHACAEAINGVERHHVSGNEACIRKDVAYQAVFNADVRDVERAHQERT